MLAKHARDPQGFYSMPFDKQHVAFTLVKVPAPPPQTLLQDTTPLPSQLGSPGKGSGGGGGGRSAFSRAVRCCLVWCLGVISAPRETPGQR